MPLSLQDIQDKQFHVSFRGFDIEEVDRFLEVIAENYALLLDEKEDLLQQVNTLTEELECVKKQESSFRNAIISAQKIADEMRKKSREEANDLLRKAHDEIKVLKDQAHREVTELESRVEELRGMQVGFENDIKRVIQAYLARLEEIPQEESAAVVEGESEGTAEDEETNESHLDGTPDLSDLYEKIDLGDDLAAIGPAEIGGKKDSSTEVDGIEFEGDVSLPDLDDDVMFTLHDPLDDEEIGIDMPISKDT